MNDVTQAARPGAISVAGIDIELIERGEGSPILYLHGAAGLAADLPFIDRLARSHRVIAPSHPGFGKSGLADWIDSVDDIAHVYLDVMDRLHLSRLDLIGMSLGGWLAAEIATKVPERFKHLVLIGPVGVKTGSRDVLDIPDIFATPQAKVQQLLYHDPEKWRPDLGAMSDEQLAVIARNRETLALLVWEPYMHNPKLPHRLHRVTMPALLLRGQSDGLVSADYLARYARLLPAARIETIAAAGHAPQVEQAPATADAILRFLNT